VTAESASSISSMLASVIAVIQVSNKELGENKVLQHKLEISNKSLQDKSEKESLFQVLVQYFYVRKILS
jgi:hypothetical protein